MPPTKLQVTDEGRQCSECLTFHPWDNFYTDPTGLNGRSSKCKPCRRAARNRAWRENTNGTRDRGIARKANWTPEQRATFIKDQFIYRLKRDFNITEEQYMWLLARQGNVCALCFEPETKVHHRNNEVMRLAVDHDHRCCSESAKSCGKCIRGLLCYSCNMMMGKIESKPALAKRFADYIDRRPLATHCPECQSVGRKLPYYMDAYECEQGHKFMGPFDSKAEFVDTSYDPMEIWNAGKQGGKVRQCWLAGKNHLCNSKCQNEPTQEEIDDLVASRGPSVPYAPRVTVSTSFLRRTDEFH